MSQNKKGCKKEKRKKKTNKIQYTDKGFAQSVALLVWNRGKTGYLLLTAAFFKKQTKKQQQQFSKVSELKMDNALIFTQDNKRV